MLTVITLYSGDALVLECHGRIVRGNETSILCSAARQNVANVVIDLKEVETIDAAGIGALVSLQAAGIYLKLANPTPAVREIFRVTHLDSVFEISEWQASGEGRSESATSAISEGAEKCQAVAT